MALVFANGTATIGTTEYSIAQNANYSSGSPKTTIGTVFAYVDLSAMTATETYQLRVYERVNGGTQRVFFEAVVSGAQAQGYTFPDQLLGDGWDVTVKKIAGTDRSILFSVRQNTNDGSISGLGAGAITSTTFATGAITAATFAAGAITSTVIAASAIGASQIGAAAITAAKFATDAVDANALAADAATEIRTGLATTTALTTAQTDLTTLTGRLTSGRATGLDNLDATMSSRAPSATAVSNVDLTPTRSAKLDQLDVATSTRAAAATALSTVQWTNTRAGNLDRLDVASSTLATAAGQTTIGVAVAAVQADTDDIQGRLPATLDAGNMRVSVQALAAGALTAIADAVFAVVLEPGAVATARTFLQRMRIGLAVLVGQGSGFAITTAGTEHVRDGGNTKDRGTWVIGLDGTRVPGTLDGD